MKHFHKNIVGNKNSKYNSDTKRNNTVQDKKDRIKQISSAQLHYVRSKRKEHFIIVSAQLLILAAFLFLWEMASARNYIDSFFFSSPSLVVKNTIRMLTDGTLWIHTRITLLEVLVSFTLVTLFSVFSALLFWYYVRLAKITEPFLVVLNSLPKSALAPLLIVWLGTGSKTIIVAGMSVAIFGSIMNLYAGFNSLDEEMSKLIFTLGGTRKHVMTKIILPASLPILINNMKVNIGLSLVGVVIGEFLAARKGLGYLIIYGTQVFKLDMVITSIILLCLIAGILYFLTAQLEKKIRLTK